MVTVKNHKEKASPSTSLAGELHDKLAHKIAFFIGKQEKRITEIPGVTLSRRTAPTAACPCIYHAGLIVVAQGRKEVQLGRMSFIYDSSRYLLSTVDLPTTSRVVEATEEVPCLVLSLKLDMSMVRELLSREEIHVADAVRERPAMCTSATTEELLSACCRLMDLLKNPADIPFLSGLVQREIIYRILQGPEGARLRTIATVGNQSQRAAKAIAWITANYAKTLRVEELAELASMGVSTLHHHFRTLTSMSPLQYQKQLRLQAARNLMLTNGLEAAGAAFEVGYESPTQFSREYSRFFGQPPMRDIRALRASAAPPSEMARA